MLRIWFLGALLSLVAAVLVTAFAAALHSPDAVVQGAGALVGYLAGITLIVFAHWLMER